MMFIYLDEAGTQTAFGPPTDLVVEEFCFCPHETMPAVWFRGSDFIIRSGKIAMVWNEWRDKWEFWNAKEPLKMPIQAIKRRFDHRFRGNNRGRHWDRKA